MYYCAPELRNPKITGNPQLAAADIYSLGKILYWLFAGEVYDGHEEDYGEPTRRLAHLVPARPQFAFIDELIAGTVRRNPAERVASAVNLGSRVQRVADRIAAGGRVLNLKVPQPCLYCGAGYYRAAHDQVPVHPQPGQVKFPEIEQRRTKRIPVPSNRASTQR